MTLRGLLRSLSREPYFYWPMRFVAGLLGAALGLYVAQFQWIVNGVTLLVGLVMSFAMILWWVF